ncbi:unnamed protein product [Polarella glacialis]|uniref:Ion transport domain-containing protein n=1 Tax=Polarella glacialis TaxID=89957 RepID=A0A813KBH5_POLGL|nr:unnamed protein product [Polarella glacialis]CAE8695846.1 unnamed protein product [Polarella glacialis]
MKISMIGAAEYFTGHDWHWNIVDVILTLIALADVCVSTSGQVGTSKITLVLRGLRLARIARLMKLLKMPLLAELANMISGFVISVPWLFWVMVMLLVVNYVCAVALRSTISVESKEAFEICGSGDLIEINQETEECRLHLLYGHEYCGSVFSCMFTIFRCMIGDCNSRSGRPLAANFSSGYGTRFNIFYCFSMVVVIFGLFNVITAMFVEATLTGLKTNDVQKKYAKLYETNYVKTKLSELMVKVNQKVRQLRGEPISKMMKRGSLGIDADLSLSESEFTHVFKTADIRRLLEDLDIMIEPRSGIFDAFNRDDDSCVSMEELVDGLMRLRGDLQKTDMVTTQLTLEAMHRRVGEIQAVSLSNQTRMLGIITDVKNSLHPSQSA